jgi:RNA polymerase sigma factor (sigma-70 family)
MSRPLTSLSHGLHRPASGPEPALDADLLDRFARRGDEEAFATLMARHGPMVLNACRRVLGDAHAAEDAFQATFLVLARKASSLSRPDTLAGWLYGVACRVARKARSTAQRHHGLAEASDPVDPRPNPLVEVSAHDLLAVLEQEMERLPEAYRLPVVLCCLEGLSQEEAAQRLGCTPGSIKGRLERGRKRLHQRLAKRGLSLSVVLGVAELARAAAGMSPALLGISAKAATRFASSQAPVGTVNIKVAALAEGVLRAMFLTRLKIVLIVFLGIVVTGTVLGVLTRQAKTLAAVEEKPKADKDALQGTWIPVSVEEAGKKVPAKEVKAKGFEMVFAGDKVTLPIKDDSPEVQYKLQPAKKPKQIDLILGKDKIAKGIYLLEGDSLKLCVEKDPGSERPSKFATEGTNHFLIVLKKKK